MLIYSVSQKKGVKFSYIFTVIIIISGKQNENKYHNINVNNTNNSWL